MHGSKSAILAIFQTGPVWPGTVSAALKNLSQDFKNYFYIGCRSRKITWITRKSLKLFHAITFTLRLQRSNYFSCFDYYFGGSHQCLQNLYLLIEKDTLKSFFFESLKNFTLIVGTNLIEALIVSHYFSGNVLLWPQLDLQTSLLNLTFMNRDATVNPRTPESKMKSLDFFPIFLTI